MYRTNQTKIHARRVTNVETREMKRERFNRRLAEIRGTDLAKSVKHFRNKLFRRTGEAIAGETVYVVAGVNGNVYRHRADELEELHKFLDSHDVKPCY